MFVPARLVVFSPPHESVSGWEMFMAAILLMAITVVVWVRRRKQPYLVVGWFWYLVMLAPIIILIQRGAEVRCDRYTYLSQIGLCLMLTWAVADLCAGWRYRRAVLGGGSAVILIALIFCAHAQTSYWRNSESLWTHTLAYTSGNAVAHNNLGDVLLQKGRVDEAITHFEKSLEFNPVNAEAHVNLGNALLQKGQVDEAIAHYQRALQIVSGYAKANYNLGNALLQKGRADEAMVYYQRALQNDPYYAKAHINLGNLLFQKGNVDGAILHYQQALQITPDSAEAHVNLGNALLQKGSLGEAVVQFQKTAQITPDSAAAYINLGNTLLKMGNVGEAIPPFEKALQITPDSAEVQNDLAWALATCPQASLRNGKKAVELAQRANQLTGDRNPAVLGTLATAYAEAGRFSEATETAQRALQLAEKQPNTALADAIRSQMKLYQAGIPFHLH